MNPLIFLGAIALAIGLISDALKDDRKVREDRAPRKPQGKARKPAAVAAPAPTNTPTPTPAAAPAPAPAPATDSLDSDGE